MSTTPSTKELRTIYIRGSVLAAYAPTRWLGMRDLNPRPPDPKSGVLPNWTNPQYAYVGFSIFCGFPTLVLTDSLLRYESYTTYKHFRSMPICPDLGKHLRDFIYTRCSNPRVVAHSVVNGNQGTCTLNSKTVET